MRVTGVIKHTNYNKRIIGVYHHYRVRFFYIQNHLFKQFGLYLNKGVIISLMYTTKTTYDNKTVFLIDSIVSIKNKYNELEQIFYEKSKITNQVYKLLSSLDEILFVDFEMSIPFENKKKYKTFIPEIIQAGLVHVKNYEIIEKVKFNIRPSKYKVLSKRTYRFLHLDKNFSDQAVHYYKFFKKFSKYFKNKNITLVVYGKNDIITLKNSYIINAVPDITKKIRIIDISKLISNYYDTKNQFGLFKSYKMFNEEFTDTQKHCALEDALVTYKLFMAFLNELKMNSKLTK